MKPICYVMVGVSGSGKSTAANKIATRLQNDCFVASTDYFIENKAKELGVTYSEIFSKFIKKAEKEMNFGIDEAIKNNKHIIWDQTNLTKNKRNKIINRFKKKYKIICCVYNESDDIIKERLKQREPFKVISENILKKQLEMYEKPEKSEGFDLVRWNL